MAVNKFMGNKIIIGVIIVIVGLILSLSLYFYQKPPKEEVIRIGYQPFWSGHSNLIQAMKRLELLEKKGYKPEYIPFLAGPPINKALAAGDLDAGFSGDMPTISALAAGIEVKVLAATAKSLRQAIVVDKEKVEEIKEVKDLVGKKVAVAKGSTSHYFLFKILRENGIDPKRVDIINMAVKDQPLALIANHIDACVAWEPWPTKLEKEGLGKILIEGGFSGYLYMRENFINKNPEGVKALVKALQEALEYSQKNFEQTCKWVVEETKQDYEVVFNSAKTDRIFKMGEDIKPEAELIESLKKGAEFLLEQNLIATMPDFARKLDFTFIDKILEEKR